MGNTGTFVDAFWHLLWEFDEVEIMRHRAHQKAYLARYGRQDWFQWEHREVGELKEAYCAVADILEEEAENSKTGSALETES